MRLIARVRDLFLANANHLIDTAEDPERMIKQVIREMDENIREARAAVVSAVASEKQLAVQLDRHRSSSKELASKAESAVAAGKEELAKAALARRIEHDRIAVDLETSWKSAKTTSESLKAQLDTLIAKRADVARKRDSLAVRQRVAAARKRLSHSIATVKVPEGADEKFARMSDRVSELEAESLAVSEVLQEQASPVDEITDLENAAQVNEELRLIKDRLQSQADSKDAGQSS
ncbi:MAG: PspA/IM30 family protein [Acidiferrobacterales bacterium]